MSRELSTPGSFLIVTFKCFGGGGLVDLFEGTEVLLKEVEEEAGLMKDDDDDDDGADDDVCEIVEVEAKLSLRNAKGSSSFSSSMLLARSKRFGL